MSKPAAFKQSDVTRLVRGAIAGGMAPGSFAVAVDIGDGIVRLLPIAPSAPVASPAEDGWDKALNQWRRSV